MKTTVVKIVTNDAVKFEKMKVIVSFYDDAAYYHQEAEVTVFIDKSINDLNEIREKAIQAAYDFLASVQALR